MDISLLRVDIDLIKNDALNVIATDFMKSQIRLNQLYEVALDLLQDKHEALVLRFEKFIEITQKD
ncbi:MAG TPA: hypothetical protein VMW10_06295 [Alphaproteobacteria bacterium]|nr:hypothetical protein [Alphaproteobacteria bacterium]